MGGARFIGPKDFGLPNFSNLATICAIPSLTLAATSLLSFVGSDTVASTFELVASIVVPVASDEGLSCFN